MKFLSAAIVAVLTAGVSMTAAAAPAGYVPYKCDNGKKLNVVTNLTAVVMQLAHLQMQPVNKSACALTNVNQTAPVQPSPTNAASLCLPVTSTKTPTTTSEVVGVTDSRNRFIVKNCEPVNIDR